MQSVLDSLCRCFGTSPHDTSLDYAHYPDHTNNNKSSKTSSASSSPSNAPVDTAAAEGGTGATAGCSPFKKPLIFSQAEVEAAAAWARQQPSAQPPTTPDLKRRTQKLALQDRQWDALFNPRSNSQTPANSAAVVSPDRSALNIPADDMSMEQAAAVAKAKLAAQARTPASWSQNAPKKSGDVTRPSAITAHKRKRSSSSSRDDIFRSKKNGASPVPHTPPAHVERPGATCPDPCGTVGPNPISRFLSNHPVLAQSLCFATPVRDSSSERDEPDEIPLTQGKRKGGRRPATENEPDDDDHNSVVSDSPTMATDADETMTSTVYYENVKLAGLQQKNPPMPLFPTFCVDADDELHQIVATRSHSSVRVRQLWSDPSASRGASSRPTRAASRRSPSQYSPPVPDPHQVEVVELEDDSSNSRSSQDRSDQARREDIRYSRKVQQRLPPQQPRPPQPVHHHHQDMDSDVVMMEVAAAADEGLPPMTPSSSGSKSSREQE